MKEITAYKCDICEHTYDNNVDALECEYKHARYNYANALLDNRHSLSTINYLCGFRWELTKEQEDITKDNCFIISHWQGYDKPAYQIRRIEKDGNLYVSGKGNWSGYYGQEVRINESYLQKPHPKEELYVYGEEVKESVK